MEREFAGYRTDRSFMGMLVQWENGRALFFQDEAAQNGHAVRPIHNDIDAFLADLEPIMKKHGWITTYDCQEQACKAGLARYS